MNNALVKIKNIIARIRGAFPSSLPQGVTEFNAWSQSIIDTYAPPMDERSVRFSLCALLMRLGQTEAYKPKRYFALAIHKGAASQIAAYVMEDIKNEQKAEYDKQVAAEAAAKLEATTTPQVADDVHPIQNAPV
jgi:hypothetical protein